MRQRRFVMVVACTSALLGACAEQEKTPAAASGAASADPSPLQRHPNVDAISDTVDQPSPATSVHTRAALRVPALEGPKGRVVARVPVGPRGVHYQTGPGAPEAGPPACAVDDAGTFWIADVHSPSLPPGLRHVSAAGKVMQRIEIPTYIDSVAAIEGGFVVLDARHSEVLRLDQTGKPIAMLAVGALGASHVLRFGDSVALAAGRRVIELDLAGGKLKLGGPVGGVALGRGSVELASARTPLEGDDPAAEVSSLLNLDARGNALVEYALMNSDAPVVVRVTANGHVQGFSAFALGNYPMSYPFCTGPGEQVFAMRARRGKLEILRVDFAPAAEG